MFQQARLKLTAWYLLIIMFISLSFSLVIYQMLSSEILRVTRTQRFRIERRIFPGGDIVTLPPAIDLDIINESRHRLFLTLVTINSSIFAITGILGYFLAGRTLRPIRIMLNDQNRFISDSSHELRTPLTSLKSAFEVGLRDRHLTLKDAKALISESIDEVNKLQTLSDGLLKLAQYQKPNDQSQFEKLSLTKVIGQSLAQIKPIARKKGIAITSRLADLNLKGNPRSLSELFTILLDNAVKYSPPKTTVTITSEKRDGCVQITVTDHGVGITAADLPHIFDRFFRTDAARSRTDAGGYGLGLSIAKKIITTHNGSITVKSKPDLGSSFIVKLPLFS